MEGRGLTAKWHKGNLEGGGVTQLYSIYTNLDLSVHVESVNFLKTPQILCKLCFSKTYVSQRTNAKAVVGIKRLTTN